MSAPSSSSTSLAVKPLPESLHVTFPRTGSAKCSSWGSAASRFPSLASIPRSVADRDSLAASGRKKVVVAGLWTEVCNTTFALSAMLEGGYEIYMVADASGGTSLDAHNYAMQRMVQAGAVPMTWQQVLLEWQRDWARKQTYDAVMNIVREHSGAYGMGVDYAYAMVHKAPERVQHGDRIGPNPAVK